MEQTKNAAFLRKRKFLLMLPLLVVPFLTMAFWALGGGSGVEARETIANKGLNMELPEAKLKDERKLDKLAFYKEADEDSLKRAELLRSDPYYKDSLAFRPEATNVTRTSGLNATPFNGSHATEQLIYQKVDELNRQVNAPSQPSVATGSQDVASLSIAKDVDRLQGMMQSMQGNQESDPEMQQLDGTLDKILDIQHPDRVKHRQRELSLKHRQQVFTISSMAPAMQQGYFGDTPTRTRNSFYSDRSASIPLQDIGSNAATAVVHETQTVSNGSTVKLRLSMDVYINGLLVPKGSFVYGTASLEGERLLVSIPGIRVASNLLPVALAVYDLDGLAGIRVPGSVSRDVAKQSSDAGLQSVDIVTMDPSLKAQAAAAGVGAAKSLLSKKVKLIRVTLKAGYRVLLRDSNKQD